MALRISKSLGKKILFGTILALAFIIGMVSVYLFMTYQTGIPRIKKTEKPTPVNSPTPTPDPLASYNVLLLGYSGSGHDGGLLTDTIIVAHIQPHDKQVKLISIPRDIWIPLPINVEKTKYYKINAAYAIGTDNKNYPHKPAEFTGTNGGEAMAKYAVSLVTGLPIKYFISINFDSFKQVVDILGGVTVYVPYTFDDRFYPIKGKETDTCDKSEKDLETITATLSGQLLDEQFTCRYKHLHFNQGNQHLNGETALEFVRSRHSHVNGGDFGRSLRQQAFLLAMKERILSLRTLPNLFPLLETLSKNVHTDIDIRIAADVFRTQGNPTNYDIETLSLTEQNVLELTVSDDGQSILVPKEGKKDWSLIHAYIKQQINSKSVNPL